jgi:hypothetical protein
MPTSRERRIFSTNSASGRETESRSAGSRGSGLGADARCPGLQQFMIAKDELGARVLHRSPLRRAPVAPSAQRQDHAQRPRVNQSRTRPDGLAIGPPGAGMPRAGAAPGIEIKHANLFRTIRCAARSRCIRAPLLPPLSTRIRRADGFGAGAAARQVAGPHFFAAGIVQCRDPELRSTRRQQTPFICSRSGRIRCSLY